MTPSLRRGRSRLVAVGILTLLGLAVSASPASAAQGTIDHVQDSKTGLQVLYSLPGAAGGKFDLTSLKVSLDKTPLAASATLASDASQTLRRTTVLAIDVSQSMKSNGKFDEAKAAAQVFLNSAPADVYVGIVTFAGSVKVVQTPSLDRTKSKSLIDGLTLSTGTKLYDGIQQAVSTAGSQGARGVLVLSDGRDTTSTPLTSVTQSIKKAGDKVDVVALAQSQADEGLLRQIADAGSGAVISANDPTALSKVFANEAQTLAKQLLITVKTPAALSGKEGTLSVSVDASGQTYTDSAFVTVGQQISPAIPGPSTDLVPAATTGITLSRNLMLGGLAAAGIAFLVILMALLGVLGGRPKDVTAHIQAYTRRGSRGKRVAEPAQQGVAAQAVSVAEKALDSNAELRSKLADRLEAAGMAIRPAEWLLVHAGIALAAMAVGFLFSSGGLLLSAIGLLLGLVVPWVYLGRKKSRRVKAFNGQLAETLQLMAGSLQAGLSLAQSVDTVVREGAEPLAGEFRRAIVESRLGVQIEDALDAVADRMQSDDFHWTVMAIRIQREVGGNLAELLITVAATLRERDYLRRQVKSLSAEGRFSAYILLALPPAILAWEMFSNPSYLHPLISTAMGWFMIAGMVMLMSLGAFMMKRMIALEV